jgi:hypothetical protein
MKIVLIICIGFLLASKSHGQQVTHKGIEGKWSLIDFQDTSKRVEFEFTNNNKVKIITPSPGSNQVVRNIYEYHLIPKTKESLLEINFSKNNKAKYFYFLVRKTNTNKIKVQIQNSGHGIPTIWMPETKENTSMLKRK